MAPEDISLDSRISWEEVRDGILRQADNKSMRPLGIPVEIWKVLANSQLVDCLEELYNLALDHAVVPDDFDFEKIFSLFKKGDTADLKNYRWLGLIDGLCKILGSILVRRLNQHKSTY